MQEQEDPYSRDAFKQYYNIVEQFTQEVETRKDLRVTARAHERCVEVAIGERKEDHPKFGAWPHYEWTTRTGNLATMREYAAAIIAACDFVDASNPKWASGHGSDGIIKIK